VLTKSKGVLIASALALAGAGGSIAVIRAASTGPENVASAALPAPIGSAATARVPTGPGSADGAGISGATGAGTTAGQNGQADSGLTGGTAASRQTRPEPPLPASAGQGDQGPLPAGALSADGAVPGALASLRALAAARTATAALPHSPQLLNQLAGPAGWAVNGATPTATATTGTTATATATATPSGADATHRDAGRPGRSPVR